MDEATLTSQNSQPNEQPPVPQATTAENKQTQNTPPVQEDVKTNKGQDSGEVAPPKHKSVKIIKILTGVLIVISCLIAIYLSTREAKEDAIVPQKPIVQEPVVNVYPINDDISTWKEYTNKTHEFYMRYPEKAVFTELDISKDDPAVFKAFYTPRAADIANAQVFDTQDLDEGFVFKVTVIQNVELKTPETAAKDKSTYYSGICPKTVKIGNPVVGKVSGFDAAAIKVNDCRGDYKITYVKRKTNMYEITQFAKGDLGYAQEYMSTSEKMLNNFKLTNTIAAVPLDKWIVLDLDKVTLSHPQMDDKCCNISGPIDLKDFSRVQKEVVLATPNASNNASAAFNGFGVYRTPDINKDKLQEFIDKQSQALIEEYKVVVGKNPETSTEKITVGGKEATYIKNVGWWGDLVIVPVEVNETTFDVYMFAKTEVIKGEFETLFREILDTVKFEERK